MTVLPPEIPDNVELDPAPLSRGEFHLWRQKDKADVRYLVLAAVVATQLLDQVQLPDAVGFIGGVGVVILALFKGAILGRVS